MQVRDGDEICEVDCVTCITVVGRNDQMIGWLECELEC